MFCYGNKEEWYKRIVPSGMLPALKIDSSVITESDEILFALEETFGPLPTGAGLGDKDVYRLRQLERQLFRAWCQWLCYPARSSKEEASNRAAFQSVVEDVQSALTATPGPYFLQSGFGIADLIFIPYVERMNASLYYYKGYNLRGLGLESQQQQQPLNRAFSDWFDAIETHETYR
jgi:glutathione S-transferase